MSLNMVKRTGADEDVATSFLFFDTKPTVVAVAVLHGWADGGL